MPTWFAYSGYDPSDSNLYGRRHWLREPDAAITSCGRPVKSTYQDTIDPLDSEYGIECKTCLAAYYRSIE